MKHKSSWVLGALVAVGITSTIAFTGCGGGGSGGAATGDDAGQQTGDDASVGDDGSSGPVCGNGVQDRGEQCDLGAENGKGMGCESNCSWTCTAGDGGDLTNCGLTVCITAPSCSETHTCVMGTQTATGGSCGMS